MKYEISIAGQDFQVELEREPGHPSAWRCRLNGEAFRVDAVPAGEGILSLVIDGRSYELKRASGSNGEHIALAGIHYPVELRDPRSLRSRKARGAGEAGPRKITAPMPGKVVRVLAPAGTEVKSGQGVIVIEAMKMQNELKSPKDGRVQKIAAAEGAAVNAGDTLAVIE